MLEDLHVDVDLGAGIERGLYDGLKGGFDCCGELKYSSVYLDCMGTLALGVFPITVEDSPVCTRAFSPLSCAEGRDVDLDIKDGSVVKCLRAHLCFSRAKYGDHDLGQAMRDCCRTICGALL